MSSRSVIILFAAAVTTALGQGGCVCADWFAEFGVSGRVVDASGAPLSEANVELTLLVNGEVFADGSKLVTSDGEGSIAASFYFGAGVCAPIGLIGLLGPRDDELMPDAARLRVQHDGCDDEVTVNIAADQIEFSEDSLVWVVELGTIEMPGCP